MNFQCRPGLRLAGDREVLEKVQEEAVKMVTGLKAVSYEDRCAELGLRLFKLGEKD